MLRMSKLADYGTVVMTYMAQQPGRVHSAPEIAMAIGLELPTVSKLLKRLVRGQMLLSQRGIKGGYMLAQEPSAISVADIIDSIEGYPMGLTECSSIPGLCTREATCHVRTSWQRISQAIHLSLQKVTLADLAELTLPPPQVVEMKGVRHAVGATREAGVEG